MLNTFSRRSFLTAATGGAMLQANEVRSVEQVRVPQGGLQPQVAVDSQGIIHLIYLYGDLSAADIGYARKAPEDPDFSAPIRVNSQPGSAIALGTVRGARLALGKSDRFHVAWNGSSRAEPKGPHNSAPMLYTRLNDRKDGFEPQRNLMTTTSGLDGGGALTADTRGNVFVAWHAQGQENGKPIEGEGHRRVWLARSANEGRTFETEKAVSPGELGACGCCGMGALADGAGNLFLLYRSARETVHRDMYLLTSRDVGRTFQAVNLHRWEIGACPMSTVSLTSTGGRVLLAWETAKQVYFAAVDGRTLEAGKPVSAPGSGSNRKHPAIAARRDGQVLLVWTEGTGWKKGGSLAWQRFDEAGRPLGAEGGSPGLTAWNFAVAAATDARFFLFS